MQESLFNTVQKLQTEQKVNIEDLETILHSDIEEVVSLCKKACLKPKTDSLGNAYFSREDVDILKKMKELYAQAQLAQQNQEPAIQKTTIEEAHRSEDLSNPDKKINFLTKAKNRIKNGEIVPLNSQSPSLLNNLQKLEENLVAKFSAILSEKMDGFDEIIVELIRSKTENENLRHQVNSLNKQVFAMKNELASFSPLPFGFYTKRDVDEL